jgi:hypothetical protein
MLWAALALTAAAKMPAAEASRYADAIYQAEGGPRAKVPYGILSVKVRDAAEARKACIRTVQRNHDRWEAAGRPGYFLHFLADSYCPPSADPVGNRNWKANVTAYLHKHK